MNSQPANPVHVVVGGMLVLVGAMVMLQRAGLAAWSAHVSPWSVLLIGFGIAKLVETRAARPRRGYIPLLFGVWLLAGDLGWLLWRDTWPLLLVAIGLVMVVDVIWMPARPDATALPEGRPDGSPELLMAIGVVLAVVLVADTSFVRSLPQQESGDRVHMFSLMTRSTQVSGSQQFRGGEMTTVMAGTELDLRRATPAPGEVIALDVRTVMGGTVLRLPERWTVEVQTLSVAGTVIDRRVPPAATADTGGVAPRVVLRGIVLMGSLVIRS